MKRSPSTATSIEMSRWVSTFSMTTSLIPVTGARSLTTASIVIRGDSCHDPSASLSTAPSSPPGSMSARKPPPAPPGLVPLPHPPHPHPTPPGEVLEAAGHLGRGGSIIVYNQGEGLHVHRSTSLSTSSLCTVVAPFRAHTKNSRFPLAPSIGEATTEIVPRPSAARHSITRARAARCFSESRPMPPLPPPPLAPSTFGFS